MSEIREVRQGLNTNTQLLPIPLSTVKELFDWIKENNLTTERRSRREVIGAAYLWGLWIGRNDCVFNNKDFNPSKTASLIKSEMFLWSRARDTRGSLFCSVLALAFVSSFPGVVGLASCCSFSFSVLNKIAILKKTYNMCVYIHV